MSLPCIGERHNNNQKKSKRSFHMEMERPNNQKESKRSFHMEMERPNRYGNGKT